MDLGNYPTLIATCSYDLHKIAVIQKNIFTIYEHEYKIFSKKIEHDIAISCISNISKLVILYFKNLHVEIFLESQLHRNIINL